MDNSGWITVTRKPRKTKNKIKNANTKYKKSYNRKNINNFRNHQEKNQKKLPILVISKEFSIMLQRARNEHKITRKKLSQLINEKESLIFDYENCKGETNSKIIQKLNKVLRIQLPRLNKKNNQIKD